jgi:predicted nucleic acid-binding OB-fold protein
MECSMHAELSELKTRIVDVIKRSAVGKRVRDIVLEADRDYEGSDFLRVILEMESFDDVSDAAMEELVESIENAVGELDERYPSVRFADAA